MHFPDIDICATALPPPTLDATQTRDVATGVAGTLTALPSSPTANVPPTPTQEIVDLLTVRVNTLNVRIAPTSNSERVGGFNFGEVVLVRTEVQQTADGFVWRQIAIGQWRGAWVASGTTADPDAYLS